MNEPNYHLTGVLKTRDEAAEDFDGPLDVILLLLSKNKIEIQDVSITAILEQYLGYLDEMKRMDMEIASEFIAMASHLMLIKTKMLLSAAEQAEAQSEMEQLIQSLQERQRQPRPQPGKLSGLLAAFVAFNGPDARGQHRVQAGGDLRRGDLAALRQGELRELALALHPHGQGHQDGQLRVGREALAVLQLNPRPAKAPHQRPHQVQMGGPNRRTLFAKQQSKHRTRLPAISDLPRSRRSRGGSPG